METLTQLKCRACKGDEPMIMWEEAEAMLPQIPTWQIVERDGIKRLERIYTFKNFIDALAFTNKVGEIAESEGHHPALLTEWGKVTVTWWTHKLWGLHQNDFIMAAKTDQLYKYKYK